MPKFWRYFESASSLLEPNERQHVLGDIHERGVTFRSFAELSGLIFARQFQAWATWRPWVLSIALFVPSAFVAFRALVEISNVVAGHFVNWSIIGVPVLAWAMGFSLSSLGKRRTLSVAPVLAGILTWLSRNAIVGLLEKGAYGVMLLLVSSALLVMIPALYGVLRGLNPRPLSITVRMGSLVICSLSLVAMPGVTISVTPRFTSPFAAFGSSSWSQIATR